MLQTVLNNFWTMVLILGCICLIILAVYFIIIYIVSLYDFFKERKKIKHKDMLELQEKFTNLVQDLDKEKDK